MNEIFLSVAFRDHRNPVRDHRNLDFRDHHLVNHFYFFRERRGRWVTVQREGRRPPRHQVFVPLH